MDRPLDGADKIEPEPIKIKHLDRESGETKELKIDPREMTQRIMKWLYG